MDPDVSETGQPYAYTGDNPINGTDPLGLCFLGGSWCNEIQNIVASNFDSFRHNTAAVADLPGYIIQGTGEAIYDAYVNIYQDGANGCSFFSLGTQEDVAGALFADESAALLGDGEGEVADALASASEKAFSAADNIDDWTVGAKHLPDAGGNWAKFATGVDPNQAVADALRSPDATFLPNSNPALPGSFVVQADVGFVVGTKGQTAIRVVVSNGGEIITAYPVK